MYVKIPKCPFLQKLFSCGHCDICLFLSNSQETVLPNGKTHNLKYRITCKTMGIVYLASCQCGCFYVGKTKQTFFKRIRHHVNPLYKHMMTTALNRHVGFLYDFDCNSISFAALEHVSTHVCGGGIDKTLLQLETKWIHILNAVQFLGLNEYISFKSFL